MIVLTLALLYSMFYVLFNTVVTAGAGASVQKNDSTFDTEQLKFPLFCSSSAQLPLYFAISF
jgi:hypothetical protein